MIWLKFLNSGKVPWKRCGNQYVQKFVFGTDDFVSDICLQPCQNLDFSVRFGFDTDFVVPTAIRTVGNL